MIIGHTTQRNSLKNSFLKNSLSQSIMLSGEQGIGKFLVAQELAEFIICCDEKYKQDSASLGGCGTCSHCKMNAKGNYPDLFIFDCYSKDVGSTDHLRKLLHSLNLKSYLGGSRIVILNNIEGLSDQASNILLKTLEEPNENTYFLLITANAARILTTIRSRCQIWHFDLLSNDEIIQICNTNPELNSLIADMEQEEIVTLVEGSLDQIQSLPENIELWREICDLFLTKKDDSASLAFSLVKSIAKERETIRNKLRFLRVFVRTQMHQAELQNIQRAWAGCLDNILLAEDYILKRNINAQYILQNILLDMLRISAGNLSQSNKNISITPLEEMVVTAIRLFIN